MPRFAALAIIGYGLASLMIGLTVGVAGQDRLGSDAPDGTALVGSYAGAGAGPTGTYEVKAEIRRAGEVLEIQWGDGAVGDGFVVDDLFVAVYRTGNEYGVVAYRIDGSRLDGQWTTYERHVIGREVLQRIDEPLAE